MDGNSSAFLSEFPVPVVITGWKMLILWDTDVETSFFFPLFDLVSPCSVISSTTSDSSKKFVFCLVILVRMPKELERLTMVGTYVVLVKLLRSPLLHVEGVFLFKAFLLNQP